MKIIGPIGLLVLLILILLPITLPDPTTITMAIFTFIFAISVVGWNMFSGYSGYIFLGGGAFFGLGAYTMAILCQDWNIPGGMLPFLLVPLGGIVAAIWAVPIGLGTLRSSRPVFVVVSIAIFFIVQLLAYNLRSITDGSTGLTLPIPPWTGEDYNVPFYYVALGVLVVAFGISWWLRHSKFGLCLLAIRDDEGRARGLGVKSDLYKLGAFVLSSVFLGMAGAIWAYFLESVQPPFAFDPTFSAGIVVMAYLGGQGTLFGPLLGAFLLEPLHQYLTVQFGTNGLDLMMYGAFFLIVLLLLPEGIVTTLRRRWMARMNARAMEKYESTAPHNPEILEKKEEEIGSSISLEESR
jgi:branched-chain amino acid transport system permease protein